MLASFPGLTGGNLGNEAIQVPSSNSYTMKEDGSSAVELSRAADQKCQLRTNTEL